MSPTVFQEGGYRFFFFSREETRMHIHVNYTEGEAKFWLEPEIELAGNYGLSRKQLKTIEEIIEKRQDEIRNAWKKYFKS
ncbi:MAG: DUF4160 domain-containing protein [Gloeocapsa sp. DLM2.Bin57]|nr:MAG: DUF4160 domain-containing protein [Gloeocapsa sp. DLM2.Bin57]